MPRMPILSRLSVRLTIAFLLAAVLGVVLVAVLAYRSTSSEFSNFISDVEAMEQMMGGGMMGGMMGIPPFAQAARDFLDSLERTLWLAGLSGVALALFLGYLFTRQIVAPLDEVTNAAGQVARGDLKQRVTVRGSGELARLGESFNWMAATLSRDQQLRQNMVADIAHELRTPLSILQGNIEAMQDGVLEASPENLASIHQETLLLARLVEDLRTLSLADGGQLGFQPQDTDLKSLTRQVLDGFQTQLAAKNITSSVEAPDNLPEVWVDPDRTAQVLRNLLSNALHFTPERGKITVKLTDSGEGVAVSVIDNGTGIPAEDLPRVFDRFYRVDRSRSRSTGGSGLGLAIVKQLVEAQGGRVWAESAEGKGSAFSFLLPKAAG
ncbi:MAG: HAMP domain-containing protein [Chloroflexi bacterium]|nr:HAMP domain-containing protein [Chloroflexota bacterium]